MAETVADQFAEILAAAGVKRNGLFDCHRSRVPVLAIAAQIPSAELGAGYFQETHPENLFKALSGDGGFTMLMGDFLSLAQLGLPVKVVVFNNSALGFIEIEQKSTGFLDFGTPIPPVITVEMAKGFTLYMVKAVFNGRVDDLIDLARSNLWA